MVFNEVMSSDFYYARFDFKKSVTFDTKYRSFWVFFSRGFPKSIISFRRITSAAAHPIRSFKSNLDGPWGWGWEWGVEYAGENFKTFRCRV